MLVQQNIKKSMGLVIHSVGHKIWLINGDVVRPYLHSVTAMKTQKFIAVLKATVNAAVHIQVTNTRQNF